MQLALLLVFIALLVALLVALGTLAALRLVRRRRERLLVRERPRRDEPATHLPLVLIHGFLGFDEITFLGRRHDYFRGLVERLGDGVTTYRPRVPALASVKVRAEKLARFLERVPEGRVNLIAHSMGGLDARYALARLGIADRVASLVTIGTPHRGTPLADLGSRLVGTVSPLLAVAGIDADGLACLTPTRMAAFNRDVLDRDGVLYTSIVGTAAPGALHPLLYLGHRYLLGRAGPNDGLVPASSQEWGEVLRRIEADHWAQIGWSRHFDLHGLFTDLLRELRGRGL